jgi:adenylate kinase
MVPAVALTGTPGTGKSSVGDCLRRSLRVLEVSELARQHGAVRGRGRQIEVDLERLSRAVRRLGALDDVDLIVGHLAHLLPVSEAIVLRCHPVELVRRLRRARRGSATDRQANFVCEATDMVLLEALGAGRKVFEIDTTARSVEAVAREVRRRLARDGPARVGSVDWLADPAVTTHLLGRAR